jgi:hypothetical protein
MHEWKQASHLQLNKCISFQFQVFSRFFLRKILAQRNKQAMKSTSQEFSSRFSFSTLIELSSHKLLSRNMCDIYIRKKLFFHRENFFLLFYTFFFFLVQNFRSQSFPKNFACIKRSEFELFSYHWEKRQIKNLKLKHV